MKQQWQGDNPGQHNMGFYSVTSGVDLGLVIDLRLPGVLLHRGDAVFAGGFCGVALPRGDDLVVVSAQPPAEFPFAIFVDFEFGHDDPPLEFDVE